MTLLLLLTGSGAAPVVSSRRTQLISDHSIGPGLTDIILSNAGGAHPRPFHASDLVMSRKINDHGQLAFDLATRDTIGYVSQADRLQGKWVRWEHPDLGLWRGMIIDVRPDPDNGILDCAAFGFSWKFTKRVTPKIGRMISGPPGAIITQVLMTAAREDPLPIVGIDADEIGDPIEFESRGQMLDDVIRAVASRSGQEWYVDPETRRLQWQEQIGRDRSGTVQLVDGVHIVNYRLQASLEGKSNVLWAAPADDRYRATRGFFVERPESIDAYGRLEEAQTYTGAVTRSSIQPIARADLLRRSRRGRTLTFDAVNIDGCFGWFGVGDTIRVVLSRNSVSYDCRVMVQSYRSDTGVMKVSGYVP
jgi:hypothetical protein